MGQLSGLVCAFLYLLAVAAPLVLGAIPANALSWALYYEVGRSFSLLKMVGEAQSLTWMWFVIFTLSVVICFLDIRRERFFVSSFVLILLLGVTLGVVYMDFILQFQYEVRVSLISPWLKIAFLVICGNFMYLALRSRFFQYRRLHRAQKAEREAAS
ncbi:MAG: hypothetical protein GKS02_14555 [Alphaproteobacteria bacterium]|nr:hypothetical protein [Alphaproteobacteria bacterium]